MHEGSRSEFDLIGRFFADLGAPRSDVLLGVGDDCALLEVPVGLSLAVSIDTLVAGIHFFHDCAAEAIGHKSLAVGLSDLAAMGAAPAWATLALTLPERDDDWLAAFARGFGDLARAYGVRLVGGDTTRGPLSVTVQVHGVVRADTAVRRKGARPGDIVWVSGTLGDAGLALRLMREGGPIDQALRARLERPAPRVELGSALRGIATAMIDLSDGLAGDLGHILAASGVGAELDLEALPLSPAVASRIASEGDWLLPLSSGDDYELCFCAPSEHTGLIASMADGLGCALTAVGRIHAEPGLSLKGLDGAPMRLSSAGYDHFANNT
ncbi:thiamine-phosphate kinase [Thiocapsa bogorovii]|uniref:thiamine-phosphate kinase n=1 Tax=Thiocapsa bogorovii TaxID=521689 RepID=UPI001E3DDF99|nr:thiamine-phosphate kinase [Thiocapsa bogorovii]UHD16741.1 thiamine-phosphate kinase [Thiocapsa bogorovii]